MKHFLHYRANRRQHLELGEVQAILTKHHIFLLRKCKFKSEKNCKSIIRIVCAEVRRQLTDTSSSSYLNNNDNFITMMIIKNNIFEYFNVLAIPHTLVYLCSPDPLEVRFCQQFSFTGEATSSQKGKVISQRLHVKSAKLMLKLSS